ncbi:MAG: tRNA lysidine(34) synthetase TilS, partial [Cyclobacteriaceae bacterium]|nr:tRNA lysidine(34) synthetase TilS [Cyclobacteriaceae bacterium]
MIDNFQSFYKKQKLFTDVSKILLAVSGGVDSMVMIHLMQEAKLNIGIAHCNFQLREEESNADEKLVEESAFRFGIEYFVKRFETIDFSNKNKIPIQQAARKLRYEWFDELLENKGYEILATAHHASDQTETIFYNLAKGCGISGLRGIPVKNENVVRPLLFATQDQILDYAAKNKIEWREDKSNFDRKYARNLIRHSIIPELKIINSGLDKTMLRNSMRYSSIEELIIDKKEEILSRYLRSEEADDILSLNWLEDTPGSFILLEEILKEYGFNFDQVSKIYDAKNQAGKVFNSKKFQLTVDRGGVYLS